MASLTKAFSTILLSDILRQSKFSWDTTIKDIMGESFSMYDWFRTEKVTLRDLAAHKVGIPPNNYARFNPKLNLKSIVKILRFLKPTREYRNSYYYNNILYGFLSRLTEIVDGDKNSWEDLMQNRIFTPLNMSSTTFGHKVNYSDPDLGSPYLMYNNTPRRVDKFITQQYSKIGASGSIMSTAKDMAKWLSYLLNPNDFSGAPLNESIAETMKKTNIIPDSPASEMYHKPYFNVSNTFNEYGLGWRIGFYRGYKQILHTGTSWGYGALLTLIPEKSIGIYTGVTNPEAGYYGRRAVHMYIMDQLLGYEPFIDINNVCKLPAPHRRSTRYHPKFKTAPRLKGIKNTDFEGIYGNFAYGNLTIKSENNELRLIFGDEKEYISEGYIQLTILEGSTQLEQKMAGIGSSKIWPVNLKLKFTRSKESENFQNIIIESFQRDSPPKFIRNLKLKDAPPPPKCPCSQTSSKSNSLHPFSILTLLFSGLLINYRTLI